MAKKATAEPKKWSKTGGQGKKQCADTECAVFSGNRNQTCPKCGGSKFVPPKTQSTGTRRKSSSNGFAAVKAVVEFVNHSGGKVADARTDLEAMAALLAETGGLKEALEALDSVEEIKKLK